MYGYEYRTRETGMLGRAEVEREPKRALERALTALPAGSGLIVCGSLYLVGEIRAELTRVLGRPMPATDPLEARSYE